MSEEGLAEPRWSRSDVFITLGLLIAAAATRFFELGSPSDPFFDEVYLLGGARNFLQAQPYRDAHPPFPAETIAVCIKLFGDNAWSRRIVSASLGTALVAITYLLVRRMFNSRLAGALAAGFVICDGLFLVDSRLALWEIFYVTFAAFAYLMTFRFAQTAQPLSRRRSVALVGLALGLGLGSKLGIPLITVLLVTGSILFVVVRGVNDIHDKAQRASLMRQAYGVVALLGGLSALTYLAIYSPNYWFGFWHGIRDQIAFYHSEFYRQRQIGGGKPHPYASPWWSWPLLLRPMLYYRIEEFVETANGGIPTIRTIGNPIEWWGALVAMVVLARQAISRRSFARAFLVAGYLLYMGMWVLVPRYQFIYYYMPALYLGFIALAVVLADCWRGETVAWEEAALLTAVAPALVLGMGILPGGALIIVIINGFFAMRCVGGRNSGRLVFMVYVGGALILFIYFLPLWYGWPLTPAQLRARMWLTGPGLHNWI